MKAKRIIASLVIVFMLLTLVCGCKSNPAEEQNAFAGDLVVDRDDQQENNDVDQPSEEQNPSEEQKPSEEQNPSEEQKPSEQQKPSGEQKPDTPTDSEQSGGQEQPSDDQQEKPSDDQESGEGDTPADDPLANTDSENKLKIIAYNIRCANDGNGNNIADRAPRFKMLVEELDADILALSEASVPWITYLEKNIVGSKYKMLYKYRAETSLEAQPLLFDYNKFELLDDGYFWLSETPDVSSIGWGGKHYRGCTWAKLKVKATGKIFLYYCTHLTGSDAASIGSAKLIYKHATERKGFSEYPVFVSGDFNVEPWTPGYTEFVTNFVDVNDYLGFDPTYTNGGYTAVGGGTHIIDYVMCSPDNVIPTHYEVLHKNYLGGFISDHKGLYVEATLR